MTVESHHVVVEPERSKQIDSSVAGVRRIDEQFVRRTLGPRPVGLTSVEETNSIAKQLQEIDRLSRSGVPSSWADLASCWRISALRPALRVADRKIGWTKMTEFEKLNRVKRQLPWDPNDYLLRSAKKVDVRVARPVSSATTNHVAAHAVALESRRAAPM